LDDEESNQQKAVHLSTNGGFKISTYDGSSSFEIKGRLLIDYAYYQEDQLNRLGSGTELRSARLGAEGILQTNWGYELELDFAGSSVEIKDAYIEYLGKLPMKFKIGYFKEPFSLEELTSRKYLTFMERALPNELALGNNIGIGFKTMGDSWTFNTGLFGDGFNDDADNEGDEGWGATGRFTFAPLKMDRRSAHLGIALSMRKPDDDNKIKFKNRPESHVTDIKYLHTGSIKSAEQIDRYGIEAAIVMHTLSLQSEYIQSKISRGSSQQTLDFDGWYIYGSWFLTGESRVYKAKKGRFSRINPTHQNGAWELALRHSQLNLNSHDITGGKAKHWTLGVNWYANPKLRFMLNYIMVDNDQFADADGDVIGNDDVNILQMRTQLDF